MAHLHQFVTFLAMALRLSPGEIWKLPYRDALQLVETLIPSRPALDRGRLDALRHAFPDSINHR
ncbi:MAG: phage tail assembly chaperone [Rhizobiaceae bacterium]